MPGVPPSAAEQATAIDEQVASSADRLCARHPDLAHPVRSSLDAVRGRLWRAHTHCVEAEAAAWAEHRAVLDRGLAELDLELGRAQESGAGSASVETLLLRSTASWELAAWRLHLDTTAHEGTAAPGTTSATGRAADVERHLRALGAGNGADDVEVGRARVEKSLDALRRALEDRANADRARPAAGS